MLKITLTYSTDEGLEEFAFEGEKISFGRGSEVDKNFDDDGLSRLHATIYREEDQFWIVDENSTNGSFVNGEKVNPHGTVLLDGDIIKIGNYTKIKINISEETEEEDEEENEEEETIAANPGNISGNTEAKANAAKSSFGTIPLLITGFAVFLIAASAVFIGVKVLGSDNSGTGNLSNEDYDDIEIVQNNGDDKPKTPKPTSGSPTNDTNGTSTNPTPTATPLPKLPDNPNADKVLVSANKKYQQLNDEEKKQYISVKAEQIAQIIGNQKSEPIPPLAIAEIKRFVDGYAGRLNRARNNDCNQGSWVKSDFLSVMERATKTSPFIVHNFEKERLAPQIGIYVAMIESEHCECLTSPTGAKGMFQFLPRTAPDYGLSAEDRCLPEPSSKAAAMYIKSLIAFSGSGPESVPLAIASYNSGQGALRENLREALAETGKQNRSFWTMVENKDSISGKYSKQFKSENKDYVPKFFATAIIGENPQDFGVNQKPLSLYR